MKKIFFLIIVTLISPHHSYAESEKTSTTEPFRIGTVLYLSNSDYANIAKDFRRGIELAVDSADIPIKLFIEDDQGQNRLTLTATQKLINIDKVDVLLFAEYLQIQVTGPLAMRHSVPIITFWESGPEIEKIGKYSFGTGLWAPSSGELPARFAFNKLNARKIAIIYDRAAWSENVVKYFKKEFLALGGEIVMEEVLDKYESDFRSSITKLKAKKADALFAPINTHPAHFFQQLKELNYTKPAISSDQISQEFIDAAHGGMEGLYFSNADDRLTPDLSSLVKAYQKKYMELPGSEFFVGLAHDATKFAIQAWSNKKKNSLRDTLYSLGTVNGVLGPININSNGSSPRDEVMYVVKNGKPKHVNF